ncbi:cell wall-binding repeat-containing protein [Herbiconiux daphne]|uniref:Cell wall-binding repeat-containing protein n=1 Tax=Herbiconiux daphne TaxID=2970914 RepID=A0ABT2H1D3_9MICO|nr:cell wall-binding repeat-containing protein [Herbiconiux daphne]MCS5733722.1 cell wall-binding repeat-containing protein [Herbiconiux daphne]
MVYVAKGTDYPDALSAGPAAAREGGPLLLTLTAQMPQGVADELGRLHPQKVVIVGGVNSVSDAVADTISAILPEAEVVRVGGADRYEVSRNLVQYAFPSGVTRLYVATGAKFPDALSASSAAGALGGAVLLVNGGASGLDSAVPPLIELLHPQRAIVAGGPNSVSPSVESSLSSLVPTSRIGGADRYEASVNINAEAFPTATQVFLATGSTFADALAGGVLAGTLAAPLFVVPGTCVTQGIADRVNSYGSTQRVILGGPNSVSDAVASLFVCPPPPPPPVVVVPDPPQPPGPPANPGDSKNCSDFPNWAAAKAWYDTYFPYYGDIAGLDGNDKDGIPCESLPGAP